VVGNDQLEVFKEDLLPAIVVYAGDAIENIPLSEAQRAELPPGIAVAEEGHCPPQGAVYPGAPQEAPVLRSCRAALRCRPVGEAAEGLTGSTAFRTLASCTATPCAMRAAVDPGVPQRRRPPNQPTPRAVSISKALEQR
jgi:hypothetical protein